MKVKGESEKVGLKLNIQNTKIMASSPITSWEIDGETVETMADFVFLGSKITADGDCGHEIKRRLLRGRKVMTNLDSIFKSRDITLPTKVHLVKAMVFPVVMHRCESWTIKKAEHRRIDAFELWCWRRLLRVLWTPVIARWSPFPLQRLRGSPTLGIGGRKGTLMRPTKFPEIPVSLERNTEVFRHPLLWALSPLLIWTGGSTPLLFLEEVPDLPVAPQDEAGLTKTFQTWPRGWFHIP